jgi:hypothetical protein
MPLGAKKLPHSAGHLVSGGHKAAATPGNGPLLRSTAPVQLVGAMKKLHAAADHDDTVSLHKLTASALAIPASPRQTIL